MKSTLCPETTCAPHKYIYQQNIRESVKLREYQTNYLNITGHSSTGQAKRADIVLGLEVQKQMGMETRRCDDRFANEFATTIIL